MFIKFYQKLTILILENDLENRKQIVEVLSSFNAICFIPTFSYRNLFHPKKMELRKVSQVNEDMGSKSTVHLSIKESKNIVCRHMCRILLKLKPKRKEATLG